jgi:multisite-specific tRNA:(cytosine-C5)-methyltransferase
LKDGCNLHALQIQIAKRGLEMTKIGGLLCYSTCSINPIEDEAVVAELIRMYGHAFEVIDLPVYLDTHCPGLIYRRGMATWEVFANTKDKE